MQTSVADLTNPLKRNFETMLNDSSSNNLPNTDSDAVMFPQINLTPTEYQMDVFKVAMRQNTIAYIDTAAGKTLIAVMIIKEVANSLKEQLSQKKLIVLLAPTRNLVEQHLNAVRGGTDLVVDYYIGAKTGSIDGKNVDDWVANVWKHETSKNQVMVMTPKILLDALRNGFIDFEMICLLIIDECNRATGNHPYALLMKEFYCKAVNKPKVFGMTASPIAKKGSSVKDCDAQVNALESILDSLVYTIQNRTEPVKVTPSVSHEMRFYQPATVDLVELKVQLESLRLKFEEQLLEMQNSLKDNHKDTDEKHEILRKWLSNDHVEIIYCLDELGLLCAYEAVKICIAEAQKAIEECDSFKESFFKCFYFLEESLSNIAKSLPDGHRYLLNAGCDYEQIVAAGYITPKLYELLHIFQSFREPSKVACLIYVERTVTAKVLDIIMKRVSDACHLEVSYLTGNSTSDDAIQMETLESFRSGKVNLLFTTDVSEEGINAPNCSTVICFDIPETVRSNVQFIIMLERGNAKQREVACSIIRTEKSMMDDVKNRDPDTCIVKPGNLKETERFYVDATGASVTTGSSISLVDQYCAKLPAENQTGGLNDHLLSNTEDLSETKSSKNIDGSSSGAGTTKRKELHGTTPIHAVSGTWGEKLDDGVKFYAYKISFICSIVDVKYSSFVLLVESKLDDDVGNTEMELYLVSKSVHCKVSSYAELYLNAEQIENAKCFQEVFFNGIFGKFICWKQSGDPIEPLPETSQTLWSPSYLYLLLPLESIEPFGINWEEIESSVSAVDFIKNNNPTSRVEKQSMDSDMTDPDSPDIIHFANKSIHINEVKNVVVLAIHSGKIYSVMELLQDETANSPFEGKTARYPSYTDYFQKKYNVDLKYPDKNLLLLKQSHRAHNLLVDFNGEGILHGKKIRAESCKVNTDRQRYYARIPPELLVVIDARFEVVKSFYLLPSLMHRLESLMLSSQLREEITGQATNLCISSSLILEALTTLRCNESFSMERLELLGDSVLKYAVSCDLYLRYLKNHGQLSSKRSAQVSNSVLHNLGISCRIQDYIRDSAFDPTRWTAPGQIPLRTHPCDHGVETIQVPIDTKYHTEDPNTMIGKFCDMGHRWLVSKTVSDCVEALVGAYYVGGGLTGALHCMRWLGVSCELEPSRINEAIELASLNTYTPKLDVIQTLEQKLRYVFNCKGLLLEAITHASQGVRYCYERLEYLGDSVLDMLITWYLYKKHHDIYPGELTDLRSASVNNENFAYAVVRRNLHPHLQYRSGYLEGQIADYVKFVATSSTDTNSLQTKKSPKALGDLLESIAGAMLVDTKLNLDEVWRIFEPLLSPIVTPDKLELPPYRELIELCDSMGYFMKDAYGSKSDTITAELRLQLKDALLIGVGTGSTRKIARGHAALILLKDLEKRGITRKNQGQDDRDVEMEDNTTETNPSNPDPNENAKITLFDPQPVADTSNVEVPVLKSINTKKGGPRSSLYELCKKLQWPMPNFTSSEQKSRSMIEVGEGVDKRSAFNIFESHISLTIPKYGVIELTGDPRADKKSSFDSAALLMLYKLQQLGKLKIG
ncbi:endoribonuclease Dicer homolog 3 [Rutidosis leptorrhynchoides]|uniref:endoribonuclease Dicer homolog 3 n=1 Tax=Rutidosis leptorrhynchoides TaxID=125765 RepID=UPI003A99A7C2